MCPLKISYLTSFSSVVNSSIFSLLTTLNAKYIYHIRNSILGVLYLLSYDAKKILSDL